MWNHEQRQHVDHVVWVRYLWQLLCWNLVDVAVVVVVVAVVDFVEIFDVVDAADVDDVDIAVPLEDPVLHPHSLQHFHHHHSADANYYYDCAATAVAVAAVVAVANYSDSNVSPLPNVHSMLQFLSNTWL